MSQNRPLWRWWLFCVALEGHRILGWEWLASVWTWCILSEWLASPEELAYIKRSTPRHAWT